MSIRESKSQSASEPARVSSLELTHPPVLCQPRAAVVRTVVFSYPPLQLLHQVRAGRGSGLHYFLNDQMNETQ